jgi:hypothetical protein
MTMKRVFLTAAMIAMSATVAQAADTAGPADDQGPEIYVVNNHLVDVRVFAEDADGKLHKLGRVARGKLVSFEISEDIVGQDFRIKVYPTSPPWSPTPDNYGVKTNVLDASGLGHVTVWLEHDLSNSVVEVAGAQ